ncbi:MAG: hypothetical protein MJ252_18410 [archaeon]|nr:hypothetical protein [archaeon]
MNKILFFVIVSFVFVSVNGFLEEPIYIKEIKGIKKNDKCLEVKKETGNILTLYLGICPTGQYCRVYSDLKTIEEEGPFSCKDTALFNGEVCTKNGECHSSVCENGICVKPDTCSESVECDFNQYCNAKTGKCLDAKPEGSTCTHTRECQFKLGCNHGICTKLFSLGIGEKAEHSYFCQSNYILERTNKTNNVCARKEKTAEFPAYCTADNECPVKSFFGPGATDYEDDHTPCVENLNSRQKTCNYDSNDNTFKSMLSEITSDYAGSNYRVHWGYMSEDEHLFKYLGRTNVFDIMLKYSKDIQGTPSFYQDTMRQYIHTCDMVHKESASKKMTISLVGIFLLFVLLL